LLIIAKIGSAIGRPPKSLLLRLGDRLSDPPAPCGVPGCREAKGKQALEDAVAADPVRFVSVAAQVLPKDVNVKNEATDAFVNLWKLISDGTAEQAVAKARGEDDGAMDVRDVA
jgi:hypothetical protein